MADNKEASSAAEDDPMLQEFTQKCQEVMEEKRRTMERELDESFNSRMSELQNRYQSQKQDSIATWQTDILRMNKIFRDIARQLGADWRPVFDTLMGHLELTEAEMDFERKKIEKQKPFMQAYKALLTWKEKNGEQFDMLQLVEALKKSNQYDLAEKTLDIMDSKTLQLNFVLSSKALISQMGPELDKNFKSDLLLCSWQVKVIVWWL